MAPCVGICPLDIYNIGINGSSADAIGANAIPVAGVRVVEVARRIHVEHVVGIVAIRRTQEHVLGYSRTPHVILPLTAYMYWMGVL